MKKMKMLKRCLVSIMAVTMCMSSTLVFADTNDVTSSGQSESLVTKKIESKFSVLVPKTIDFGESDTVTFDVQAKGNIARNTQLHVTMDDVVPMYRENDTAYAGNAAFTLDAVWTDDVLSDTYSVETGNGSFRESLVGSYHGVTNFYVNLEEMKTAECKHENVDWVDVTAATCMESGKRAGVCKDCGADVEDDIPALGHDMSVEDKELVWVGYYECNVCHATFDNIDDCADHCLFDCDSTYTSKEKQVEQVIGHHCSRCGEKDYEPAE